MRAKKAVCMFLICVLIVGMVKVPVNAIEAEPTGSEILTVSFFSTRATGSFNMSIPAKSRAVASSSFPLAAGETVTIKASYSPFSASVDVGLIAPDGTYYYFNITNGSIDELSMEKLHDLGVSDLAQQQVSKLSGGEKQRVAIARALVNDPSIILADEPTGALDTKNTEMIMDIFKRLNNQGKTIIVVTHDDFVAKSCKRVITLSDGKIVDDIVKK